MAELRSENGLSVAELYSTSIELFANFVLALSKPDCDVVCRDDIQLPQIMEEYGRTKIWADQSRADLPARARGSLDDTLRHNNELKSLVSGILQRLRILLHQATDIAQRKYNPEREPDQDSVSSVSDSDYSTGDEDESSRRRMPKIRLLVQQITDQIRSLYELSSLLRRPTVTDKFIRSSNALNLEATSLQGLDSPPLDQSFETFDNDHVLEKVRQWRGCGKSFRSLNFTEEEVAVVGEVRQNFETEGIEWFCRRLTRANTKRRERLHYWKRHPYDMKQVVTVTDLLGGLGAARKESRKEDSQSQVSTVKLTETRVLQDASESVFTRHSFSTVAFSDVHDAGTNIRPRTEYAPTEVGQGHSISIPWPPAANDGQTTFLCPYCGVTLQYKDMTRQSWKRHVFRDLRPYLCTFEKCDNSGKLFSSRHEWQHHEFQVHRREYVCQKCRSRHTSREEMSAHILGHYGDSISSAQMNILLDLCDRQIDPSHGKRHRTELCILCGVDLLLSQWHEHVAAHMENISLFVLPIPDEDGASEGSAISGKAKILKSDDDNTGSISEISSLGFSSAGDNGQTPAKFANLLASIGGGNTSELSHGKISDDGKSIPTTGKQIKTDSSSFQKVVEEIDIITRNIKSNSRYQHAENSLSTIYELVNNLQHLSDEKVVGHVFDKEQRDREQTRTCVDLVQLCWNHLGDRHRLSIDSMTALARLYEHQDNYALSESLRIQVVEAQRRRLGPEHDETLASMQNLAFVYEKQWKYYEAEALRVQILEIQETTLGSEHPDTLVSMKCLASIYERQQKYSAAEVLRLRLLEIKKREFGTDHISSIEAIEDMAYQYEMWKEYEKSEALWLQVLESRKTIFGPEHRSTLKTMEDLASMYGQQQKYDEAETLRVQVLEILRTIHGPEHGDTIYATELLARTLDLQEKYDEAKALRLQVLEGRKSICGPGHPETINAMESLASAFERRGKHDEAETLRVQVLEILRTVHGPGKFETINAMTRLASTFESRDKFDEAEMLIVQAVDIKERVYGPEDPSTRHSRLELESMRRRKKGFGEPI